MSEPVQWEDPPPKRRGQGRPPLYVEFFDALRGNPGQWALYAGTGKNAAVATKIRQGRYAGTTVGEFDAVARKQDDGTHKIWVRYIGGEGVA